MLLPKYFWNLRRDNLNLKKARTVYLLGSFLSFVLSVSLWFAGYKQEGIFVGVWVPSILSLGNLMLSTAREGVMDIVNWIILLFGTVVAGSSLFVTCLIVKGATPENKVTE